MKPCQILCGSPRGYHHPCAAFDLVLFLALIFAHPTGAADYRGREFLGFTRFDSFKKAGAGRPDQSLWISPEIGTDMPWDQLILSWNIPAAQKERAQFKIRAIFPDRDTPFFAVGDSAPADSRDSHRIGLASPTPANGDVQNGVLVLRHLCRRFQVRITWSGTSNGQEPRLELLGVALLDSRVHPRPLPPNRQDWGTALPVIQRSLLDYPQAKSWDSPACTSMILWYWGDHLHRPDLHLDVPLVADQVRPSSWALNAAYAGACPGMRAYVTRLSSLAELEEWIDRKVPVAACLKDHRPDAPATPAATHAVVCLGFTGKGDVIVNDPGARSDVRQVYPRQAFLASWKASRRTVYLIYPKSTIVPEDRFHHWLDGH